MIVQRQPAAQADEDMLALAVDPLDASACDLLGDGLEILSRGSRSAQRVPGELLAQPSGAKMNLRAFRHVRILRRGHS
jgi:hypothetical protein